MGSQSWGKFNIEGFKGFYGLYFQYPGKQYLMDYELCVTINTCA